MGRYLDPTNDVAFKRVFSDKTRMLSFLNSILRLKDDSRIIDLEFISPEELPDFGIGKRAVFDLKVQDKSGNIYVIEMQNRKEDHFLKRMQFYASTAYTNEARIDISHNALVPVILIAITNSKIFPDHVPCISHHTTLEMRTKERFLFDVAYVFVELPKFNKKSNDLTEPEDSWLYFLSNPTNTTEPPSTINDKAVLDAYTNIEEFRWSAEQYDAYIRARLAAEAVELTMEGEYKRGEAKGIEQGSLDEKKKIAQLMLSKNMALSESSDLTGLSLEALRNLNSIS